MKGNIVTNLTSKILKIVDFSMLSTKISRLFKANRKNDNINKARRVRTFSPMPDPK